jgi:hypothetical protein
MDFTNNPEKSVNFYTNNLFLRLPIFIDVCDTEFPKLFLIIYWTRERNCKDLVYLYVQKPRKSIWSQLSYKEEKIAFNKPPTG